MRSQKLHRWLAVGAMLVLPVLVHAQEATLSGTVSDTTGGALPGVTVRALHEASGNSFEAVTDARGDYRLAVRVGAYRVRAELAGFAPVTRTLTLLVGQEAVVNLQMAVLGLEETVTVTGEAPLLDVTSSSMGGNIDPRQLEALPVQGRNWLDLLMLAPGARGNALDGTAPRTFGGSSSSGTIVTGGQYEVNIDGQQVTQLLSASGGSRGSAQFSRDTIGEFELLSSRFNALQGRSLGLQVNAITKSGTNTSSGSFAGYFRDDRFRAADPVTNRNLPYQNQQLSGTFGGPIRKDRVHVFANYEFEREPSTGSYTTPYAIFNLDLSTSNTKHIGGVRLDSQFSPRTRLAVRFNASRSESLGGGGADTTPMSATGGTERTRQVLATLTQVFGHRVVNELKVGYSGGHDDAVMRFPDPGGRFFGPEPGNRPIIVLQGITVGGSNLFPGNGGQDVYTVRDDLTLSFAKAGRHTMKVGGEYLRLKAVDYRCTACEGELTASSRPIPADMSVLFPDPFDTRTWNLNLLSPIATRWRQPFAPSFRVTVERDIIGGWVQDDWTISPRLTLNLGLRYDLEVNAFVRDVDIPPFRPFDTPPDDRNNFGPRVGFTFSANDRTVFRGGFGTYFGTVITAYATKSQTQTITLAVSNDARPDFATNPWNGPTPTYEFAAASLCTPALERGCLRREMAASGTATIFPPEFTMPYAYQSSIGLQRQVGETMAIEVDYAYTGMRDYPSQGFINLTYDPATGANYPFSDISRRPFPEWGFARLFFNGARANTHSLHTGFTKRFSGGWQASGTYTLSAMRDASPRPRQWTGSRFDYVPFATAPDLGGEYTLTFGDQRHRAVLNGIWELPYGFQLSGLYFFGSGERFDTKWAADLRQIGSARLGEQRLRPDGTFVPRNSFVGKPIHRVDLRLQRRFSLGGRAGIDGLVEVYNVFSHANYGDYVTNEAARNYGAPRQEDNVAYAPRTLQLGFRFSF